MVRVCTGDCNSVQTRRKKWFKKRSHIKPWEVRWIVEESDSHIGKTWGSNWDLKGAYSFHREFSQDPERKGKEGEGGRGRKGEKESEEGDCI